MFLWMEEQLSHLESGLIMPRIDWWKVYRNLKHDKVGNKESATLKIVLNALAALFLLNVHHYESRSYLRLGYNWRST